MAATVALRPPWCPAPGAAAQNNQPTSCATDPMSLKLEDSIVLRFISYVKARLVVDASCLCLPVAAAAGGRVWLTKSCSNPSLYLWPSFPHGRTGKDSDGRLLSLAVDTMVRGYLECFSKAIYQRTYLGLFNTRLFFKGSIPLLRTSKARVITTSTLLRQQIFCYEDSVHDPQTL